MISTFVKQRQGISRPITIDFSPVTNYPSTLILSHWDSGITWALDIGGSIERYQYYDEIIAPLSFIAARAECNEWYLSIPEEIRTTMKVYSYNDFAILYLISNYSEAYQLFMAHPTLFSVMLLIAKEEKLEEKKFVELLSQPRTKIMQYCGLPATKGAIKLLGKVKFISFNSTVMVLIEELFKVENYVSLNHREYINLRIIKLLYKYPDLVKTRFIRKFDADYKPGFSFLPTIKDILRLAGRLEIDGIKRIGGCNSYQELVTLHDKLAAENSSRSSIERLGVSYAKPPVQGNKQIVPVTTWLGLFDEGANQHHCVDVYHEKIMAGEYYVYKVLLPERATLGLNIRSDGRPKLDQIRLARNGTVSDETRLMVESWLNENKEMGEVKC